jgi:YD repeat-containing protein
MVAIVAGNGLGLLNTSLDVLGGAGVLGQSVLGQGGSRAFVNAASGNLVLQMQDEQLAGRGLDLYALRTYNSLGTLNDGDGDGWRWGYEQTVRFQGPGTPAQPQASATVIRVTGDGHETTYTWNAARAMFIGTEGPGADDELRYDSGLAEWVWADGSIRVTERYSNSVSSNMAGRLTRRTDTSSNSIDLTYDTDGRLTLIRDAGSQQELQLKYGLSNGLMRLQRLETRALIEDAGGRATAALGDALRSVEYGYDNLGRLTTVTTDLTPADGSIADGAVFATNYTYDQTTARIASVTQSDGTSVFFTYDAAGRVSTAKDHGGAASAQVTFTYDTATNSSAITDGNGQVWTYRYDANNQQLTEILAPAVDGAALSTKFQYDASGNLASITDARNNTVTYGYDSNGNRTLERDALGNTVTRTFGTLNQMLTETRYRTADPDGDGAQSASDPLTTRYIYDENARVRFVVSAEGRVIENRYGTASVGYGLLTHTLQYVGQVYDLTGLSADEPLTEAQLTGWVAGRQDKTQVQLTEFSYDFRGKMSQQTSYAAVSASGTGVLDEQASVTEYFYDAHSRLRQRIVVRGGGRDQRTVMTSFAYDGMGRALSSTDANGTQTTVYDDANRNITVAASSGLTETRGYDSRGRLVSTRQKGDGTTRGRRYVYNNADQLRMVEDAQDGRRYRFYDAAGQLAYAVDATGAVTRSEYNATGQLVRQTQYLNRADASSWYDGTTQTVTKLSLTVGGSSSDVPADAAHDRVTTFDYDSAGRLTTSTDAANTVTTTRYDGASRVVMTQTADHVTQFLYDADNRKVGSVDALGYLTEYKYDAGGRLIETVRYSQRSPIAANLAAPVWIGVSNQNAIAGQPFEYRMPATDTDGDSLSFSFVGTPPAWLNLDVGSGGVTLKGTPPNSLTSYDVTLRADDSRGKTSDVTLRITVADSAPRWEQLPDSAVPTNATGFNLTLPPATDNESAAALLTYSIRSAMPPGLTFNAATHTISGVPTTPGLYTITARVADPQGLFTDRSFLLQVTNVGPTWAPVPVQVTWINQAFTFTVPAAVDPEGQALTYSVISKPSWLSFNPTTHTLSGTPPTLGLQAVVLEAQDAFGETVRLSFSIDVGNRPPTWGSLPDIVTQAGTPIDYTPQAAIDPDGELLTYSASGLPAGLLLSNINGRISGTSNAVGVFAVTLRATDPHGASIERSVALQLNNAVPVYNGGLSDIQLEGPRFSPISLDFSFPVSTFTDGNHDVLTYSVSGAPGWLNFDSATRRFSGSSSIITNQNFLVAVTASDPYGATASGTFGLSVKVKAGGFLTASTRSLAANTTQALAARTTESDILSSLRPTSNDGLHTYQYYDGQGRVVGSVNEQGFLSETVYDAQANKQQSVRYLNAVAVGPTDTLATLKAKAGSAKQTTTIEYDGLDRVSSTIGVDGTGMRNEYDSAGRLVRQTSADSSGDSSGEQRASRTRYNAFGEVTGTLGGVGEATLGVNPTQAAIDAAIASYGTRYEYSNVGQRTKAIDANDNSTWFYYDGEGHQTHTINALGEVAETIYNRFGEAIIAGRYATRLAPAVLTTLTGGQTTLAFLAQVQALTNASKDQTTSFGYDQRGLLIKQTDGLGFVTANTYNAFGQLATQTRTIATGKTTTTHHNYNLRGELIAQTGDVGGLNFNTQTVYDAFGRITEAIDGAGKITTTRYQDNGRAIEVTDPLNRKVRSESDAFARALKTIDASGQLTTYAYDDVNRSVKLTTPEGITVTTNKTRYGETLNVVDGRGNTTAYEYNKNGQRIKVTDALGQVISQTTYDNSGRMSQITDARGTGTKLSYDAASRVILRQVDPAGLNLETRYLFDAFGQQINVTEGADSSAARVTDFEYDRKGQLTTKILDPNGLKLSTRYSFDGLGNTIKVEQGTTSSPSQRVTLVEFDQLGRRIKEIVAPSAVFGPESPNTRDLTTEHLYDAAGRLSCTIHPDGNRAWYVYDAVGQQIQTINAMGEVSESVYHANGREVQSRRYFNRLSAEALAKLGDAISAPVTLEINTNDQRSYFVYDHDGRQRYTLQAFIGTSWTIAENRFDANGNIVEVRRYHKFLLEEQLNAIDTSASPGISVAEAQAELAALGYSEDDSALAKTRRTRFAYDANNRLRFTVDALGSVSESAYDPAGQLVSSVRYATRPTLTAYTESAINAALNRTDTSNQVSHYAFDAVGRLRYSVLVLASDATGKPTQQLASEQAYDSIGQVVQTIAYATPLGSVADYKAATIASAITAGAQDRRSAFVYDAPGRKIYSMQVQIAGSQNIVSKLEFDALDRLVESTSYAKTMALADFGKATLDSATTTSASAEDRTTHFVYDVVGRQRFAVGADGSLSEKVYDALGRVKESRQFDLLLSNTTPRTEDTLSARRAGRAVGDGKTRGEKYSYDRAGRLLRTTDAATFTETNEYNALGDKTSFIDKNGAKWRYVYDRQGRLFDQYSPSVLVQLSNETAPTNRSLQTRLYHDAFGSLVKRIDAAQLVDQRITEYAYDLMGRQIVKIQAGWYDPATGRVEASSAAGRFQRSLATTYDVLGNQVRTKLQTGINRYQYEYKTYDNLGRVVYDVDALSNVTAFAYNAFGEQTSVKRYSKGVGMPPQGVDTPWTASALASALDNDPLARTMTMRYDNLGRKTQTIQPTVASYFFSGSFSQFVPLDSTVTPVSASASTTFEYNPFGELFHQTVQLDDTRAQETWRYYDAMGRETRTIVKSSDNIASEGSPPRPGGVHTARSYDALGNLTLVIEYAARGEAGNSGNFLTVPPTPDETSADRISSYVYDARNQQTDTLRSNLSYTALENGQYVQVELGRGNGVKVQYTEYDGLGRMRASTDAMNNVTRSVYNALGQLIQVTEPARFAVKSGLTNPDPFLADSQILTSPVTDLVLNAFGQTVKSTRSPGRSDVVGATLVTSTSYDFGGNAVSTTDAKGHVKNWQYDFSGRLVKEFQAISSTLGRRFDAATQGLQVWRVIGHTLERRYAYDAVGHMTDALDVFMNGPTLAQSGQRKVYNAFGEVTDEQIVWGAASEALSNLHHATRLQNSYDNAGKLVTQYGADGQTQFFYNLTGQVTRTEQRGDNNTADSTHTRIVETGYDLMGRSVWQSKPIFSRISDMVTPEINLILDRWGNVSRRMEVGDLGNGLAASIRVTSYQYNADNKVISAVPSSARALRGDGTSYIGHAIVTHHTHYDLAGRVVEQIDGAEDSVTNWPGSVPHSVLRTRSTTYDGIGQVVEQQDAEQLSQGQHGLRYAYDADGNKGATVNAVGNVFVDTFDATGNQLTHKVLRLSPGGENDTYVSGSGNIPVAVLLNSHNYDQANRRIETRDYVSTSLFNANFAQYDERGFLRGTFQLQETDGSLPYSEDSGRETSCVYDILGNKVQQTDDSGHSQAWSYNTVAEIGDFLNFAINRLNSTTSSAAGGGFNHTTAYAYTDFGQVKQETYTGTDITDSTAQNNRVYEYKENGLLAQTTDHQTVGTPGLVGGLDYWTSTSISKFSYTDRGSAATGDIDTTGVYEDFAQFGGAILTKVAQPERRTIGTSYDERDRPVSVINSCFDIQGVSKRSSANVTYDYDELGNRTRITFSSVARSTMPGSSTVIGELINGRQLWFNYDHEGRMTLAGKTIEQDGTVTDAGVVITYDAAGRRATALTREGRETRSFLDPETGGRIDTESWDLSRQERYTYNDLGYLTKIEQCWIRSNKLNLLNNTPIPDDPGPSPFMPSEARSYDFLGNLSESRQYNSFYFVSAYDMTMEPQSLSVTATVNNHYTAAGLLDTQSSTHPASPRANTHTKNLYDNHGILQSYTYTKGDGLGTNADNGFKNTYTYSHAFKAGALREGGIDVESNLQNSTTTHQRNTYDGRGNLVWQRSMDGPGNTEMVFFDYDGSGRVLDKAKIDLPPSRQAISGDKYNSFFYNSSGEAIGNVPTSSFAATRASLHANFGIGFTPVSTTYPSSQPTSYAVVAGDTLASIAKSFLGDAQLWYLIADANGLTAGPTDSLQSQVGRSLRIPNVVANVRNNAETFSPYNPNTIISNTPWVGAPLPPPGPSSWEQAVQQMAPALGMATSMVLGVILSELGPLGVGIAAAAGNVVNQGIQISGHKELSDFDVGEVGEASLTGFVAGGLSALGSAAAAANGGGLAAQALAQSGAAAATYAVNSGIHEAFHRGEAPASFSGWSLLSATAGAAATPVLGGFFSRLAQEALNPKTGWVWHPNARAWDAFYQELGIGLGQLVIHDSFGPPRHESSKAAQRSQSALPAELINMFDEIDRQFYKADLAAQTVAKVEQPDAISSADWAAEKPDALTLAVPSDHEIVQALRTKQVYVVQKGDRSTEDIAEHMGHDRRDGSYLALANGYDPRYVKEGDVFFNTYVSPNDARLANAQIYPLERQAKLARNERRLQQELAAGRQRATREATLRSAEEEELRGLIGEPPSLETLANMAMMGLNNPAVQTALLNPDLGRTIPATKTIYYQGVPFTVASGLHEIGSQPEIDADWSANSMVVDMVDIRTPSEIANRTGQSDYLSLERYMKRFPSSSLEHYLQYRAGADRETVGAWDRYSNAFNIGSFIAKVTTYAMAFPALENPIGFGLSYYAGQGAGRAVNYLTGSDFLGMLAGNLAGTTVAAITAPKGNTVGGLLEAQRRARLDLTLARTLPEGHVWTSVAPGVEIGLYRRGGVRLTDAGSGRPMRVIDFENVPQPTATEPTFSNKLAAVRQARDLTQAAASDEFGIIVTENSKSGKLAIGRGGPGGINLQNDRQMFVGHSHAPDGSPIPSLTDYASIPPGQSEFWIAPDGRIHIIASDAANYLHPWGPWKNR